jgi:SAM-dependent methyltransferase
MTSEWTSADNPMLDYYDADFPSPLLSRFPENFDSTTVFQGLAHDVTRYREIAANKAGPVLELCCGTGRVAIPLALDGHRVTAVDFSEQLLEQMRGNVRRVAPQIADAVTIVRQDVTALDLGRARFRVAIVAFNSLLCIPRFDAQRAILRNIARHLLPDGILVLDLINPLVLKPDGEPVPLPFFTRRHPATGKRYTRFAALSPFDADHVQRLYGWYDEVDDDGTVRRRGYQTFWRPIYRFELDLMLAEAGLAVASLEGGHQKEPYTASSPRMFVCAALK